MPDPTSACQGRAAGRVPRTSRTSWPRVVLTASRWRATATASVWWKSSGRSALLKTMLCSGPGIAVMITPVFDVVVARSLKEWVPAHLE